MTYTDPNQSPMTAVEQRVVLALAVVVSLILGGLMWWWLS